MKKAIGRMAIRRALSMLGAVLILYSLFLPPAFGRGSVNIPHGADIKMYVQNDSNLPDMTYYPVDNGSFADEVLGLCRGIGGVRAAGPADILLGAHPIPGVSLVSGPRRYLIVLRRADAPESETEVFVSRCTLTDGGYRSDWAWVSDADDNTLNRLYELLSGYRAPVTVTAIP